MIVERKNKIVFFFILFLSSYSLVSAQCYQSRQCVEKDTLLNSIVQIKLPCDFKKKIHVYEEGKFIDYYYKDGTTITLFKGALQGTPLLSSEAGYSIQKQDTTQNRIITIGEKDGKAWREDAIEGVRIYYNRISPENKHLFDAVLDSLFIYQYKNQ